MSQDKMETAEEMFGTPEQVYDKISLLMKDMPSDFSVLEMWWLIKHYRDQVEALAGHIAEILAEAHINSGHVGSGTSQCGDKIRKESLERILTHCEQSLSVFVKDKWRE